MMEREIRKILTFVICQKLQLKFSEKSHKQKSEKIIHSGFHKQRFLIPESGVPNTGQSTDSYWIVGTQVSAADFAGRRTRQRTEIPKRI